MMTASAGNHLVHRIEAPIRMMVRRLSRSRFVRAAIEEQADLSAFRQPPTARVILGVGAILLSYVIGWPLVALLAAAAIYYGQPLIAVVGGPVAYGSSHLVFLAGMYLAGAKYSWIFLRWATRVAMLRLLARYS